MSKSNLNVLFFWLLKGVQLFFHCRTILKMTIMEDVVFHCWISPYLMENLSYTSYLTLFLYQYMHHINSPLESNKDGTRDSSMTLSLFQLASESYLKTS